MLPAVNRMRKADEFARTIRHGRRSGNKIVVVHALNDKLEADLVETKVGFVVGKSVGNSVVRHRVVRKLRHAMRDVLGKLSADAVVVRALPASATANFQELSTALRKGLERSGAMSEPETECTQ